MRDTRVVLCTQTYCSLKSSKVWLSSSCQPSIKLFGQLYLGSGYIPIPCICTVSPHCDQCLPFRPHTTATTSPFLLLFVNIQWILRNSYTEWKKRFNNPHINTELYISFAVELWSHSLLFLLSTRVSDSCWRLINSPHSLPPDPSLCLSSDLPETRADVRPF